MVTMRLSGASGILAAPRVVEHILDADVVLEPGQLFQKAINFTFSRLVNCQGQAAPP